MKTQNVPQPGEFYRHFKNRLYQVIGVAYDSETAAPLVVYQALYGEYRLWVRPLAEFMSEVDHEKYPHVRQTFRFERVVPGALQEEAAAVPQNIPVSRGEAAPAAAAQPAERQEETEEGEASRILLAFLDTDNKEERKAVLVRNIREITQSDLDGIYVSYGITGFGGNIPQQVDGLVRFIDMQEHYEGDHLRGGKPSCSISGKN